MRLLFVTGLTALSQYQPLPIDGSAEVFPYDPIALGRCIMLEELSNDVQSTLIAMNSPERLVGLVPCAGPRDYVETTQRMGHSPMFWVRQDQIPPDVWDAIERYNYAKEY